MKTIELVSLVVGLITGLPYIVRLVKRFCPVLISFTKDFLALIHDMILDLGKHQGFVIFIQACPWMLRSGFYIMGVLLAIQASHEKNSLPTCLGCFVFMAAVGEVEFYLFSKMASFHKNNKK